MSAKGQSSCRDYLPGSLHSTTVQVCLGVRYNLTVTPELFVVTNIVRISFATRERVTDMTRRGWQRYPSSEF